MARLLTVVAMTVAMGVYVSGCSSKHSVGHQTPDDLSDSSKNDTGDNDTVDTAGDKDAVDSDNDNSDGDTQPSPDITPPDIRSVAALTHTTVQVVFSESLSATSIAAADFHIQSSASAVTVLDAQLQSDGLTVMLTVDTGMQQGATYTLLAQSVSDVAGNVVNNATKDFIGRGAVVAELTGAPSALTNVASLSVTVGGADIVAYQYALTTPSTAGTWSAETPIATLVSQGALVDGAYTLKVVGKDSLSNWQDYDEPTTVQWVVDTMAPTAVLTSTPSSITSATSFDFKVGGEGVVAYMFSLDAGPWSEAIAVSTSLTIDGLTEGAHTLAIVGSDQAGNWQAVNAAATFDWLIDSAASIAVLEGVPSDPTSATSLDVTVKGVTTYTYSLDGGDMSASVDVATPITATDLTEGTHTLSVIGADADGNPQATPTQYTWTIDLTPPLATIANLPTTPTSVTTTHIVVGGDGVLQYRYRFDAGSTSGLYTATTAIDLADIADGTHTIDVFGIDAAGNVQSTSTSYTWVVDTVAPTAQLSSVTSPSNSASATLTVSGTDVTAYKYDLDGNGWSAETPVATAIALTSLSEGSHTVRVIGRDDAGNYQSIASATALTWVVDLTPPEATLTGLPPALTNTTAVDVTVGNCVAYMVQLDNGTWSSETAIAVHVTATGLNDGPHTIAVVGRDQAGNWQTDATTYNWTVDTSAPAGVVLSNLPANPSNDSAPSITVGGAQIVGYKYQIDNGTWSGLINVATPITLSLGEGSHTLAVRGENAAGNLQESPTTVSWVVDLTPPTVTLSGAPTGTVNVNTATITVSGAVSYSYRVDGGTWSTAIDVGTVIALSGLADGAHALDAIGLDAAGNWQTTPTSASWSIDTTPPVAPVTSDKTGSVGGAGLYSTDLSLTFTWTNPSDAAEVAIQVATDAAFAHIVFGGATGTSLGTAQTYDYIVDPSKGAVYYARVRVRDAAQNWSAFGTASDGIDVVGGISGVIKSSTLALINGATVSLQLMDGTAITSTTSDATGKFTLANVDIGDNRYKLVVSATGYGNAAKNNISVSVGATTDLGIIYLVSSTAQPGTIAGTVIEANAGAVVSGASVKVIDWTGTTVTTKTSASDGTFTTASVSPGTYTVLISANGFFDLQVDNLVVNGNLNIGRQALCQVLAEPQVRVVLLWGSRPTDLDLHVVGPTAKTVTSDGAPNNRFHVYWSQHKSFDENTGAYLANGDPSGSSSTTSLVQDQTRSYGPEAINLFGHGSGYAHGVYTFSVHDYSATDWYAAPITLRIYDSQGLVREIPIPSGGGTNYIWQVFKMDIEGNSRDQRTITVSNTFIPVSGTNYATKSVMDW